MPSILDAKIQLQFFADKQKNIPAIIESLDRLLEPSEEGKEKVIELLRKDLLQIVSNLESKSITAENLSLKDAAYNMLLALAEAYPINDVDQITLDPIAAENRIVISTGWQYDLPKLLYFHNNRAPRNTRTFSDYGSEGKLICDPLTNVAFSAEDMAHIRTVAVARNIPITTAIQVEGKRVEPLQVEEITEENIRRYYGDLARFRVLTMERWRERGVLGNVNEIINRWVLAIQSSPERHQPITQELVHQLIFSIDHMLFIDREIFMGSTSFRHSAPHSTATAATNDSDSDSDENKLNRYLFQLYQMIAAGVLIEDLVGLPSDVRTQIISKGQGIYDKLEWVSLEALASLRSDVREDILTCDYSSIRALSSGSNPAIPLAQLDELNRDLRKLLIWGSGDVVKLIKEKDVSIKMLVDISYTKLQSILVDRNSTIDQKAELVKKFQPKLIVESIVKLDSDGLLQSIIRGLWKETRSANVITMCGQTEAEHAYRAIQTIFEKQPASNERALSVLSRMHEFVMKQDNQEQPFAVALKNKFNLDAMLPEYIASARVAGSEGSLPLRSV